MFCVNFSRFESSVIGYDFQCDSVGCNTMDSKISLAHREPL